MTKPIFTFVCPGCGESVDVNAAMKEALLEQGCVLCGTLPTAEDFLRDA